MKRQILILFVCIFALSQVRCQIEDSSSFDNKRDFMQFHTSTFWSKDFYGDNFFAINYGFDFARQINKKTTLFVGVDMINIDTKCKDLAPRRNKTGVDAQLGMSYQFNDKLTIYGSVFYNSLYNSIGADLDITYRFNEDAFINFYASFSHTDNTWLRGGF
ncbi:MAG: hypothetical protein Q4Q06_04260 [Bacteroidota bacterium]|nr:hypothetical protein [Bacteroidota bacterium]